MLDLADFALQEQPEDNLMFAIYLAWYNGSYTMTLAANQIIGIASYNDPVFNKNQIFIFSPLPLRVTRPLDARS